MIGLEGEELTIHHKALKEKFMVLVGNAANVGLSINGAITLF
ncbi:MAG: hypothetical protein AB7V32_05560 [Candidatus Berkiella sp.]